MHLPYLKVSSVLVEVDELLQFVSVDDNVEPAHLGQSELALLNACEAHLQEGEFEFHCQFKSRIGVFHLNNCASFFWKNTSHYFQRSETFAFHKHLKTEELR